ncbi:MAG: 6-carboxytetrahydropterin synthase [Acidobacteria bacterium]|nr:6-carboxytetrahydropterin synthase [Acidobacteriota bacterium]
MKLSVTRQYVFAASHRLYTEALSEEENRRAFGKCANPYGHGHNYLVEVTVTGPLDGRTGRIADPAALDAFVEREVLSVYDHRDINSEVPEFREMVPTTENVCMDIYRRLNGFPGARLERIRIEETGRNSFEYAGE